MAAKLHIIASCADRKSQPVPSELHLKGVKGHGVEVRAEAWWRLLSSSPHKAFRARELYVGEHWGVISDLPRVARASGFDPVLWIASAGYGLVPEDALLKPYSATFSRGNVDSVVSNGGRSRDTAEQLQSWWRVLGEKEEPSRKQARSIHALAQNEPTATIIVIAPPMYVAALAKDLAQAIQVLRRRERMLVVSAPGTLGSDLLAASAIPSSAHHQTRLGGSKHSLHARVARELLEEAREGQLDARQVQQEYLQRIVQTPLPTTPGRTPQSDNEVKEFIQSVLNDGVKTWSAALRRLRSQGLACEQSRFKRLFLGAQEDS